jgi:hypothetical protein
MKDVNDKKIIKKINTTTKPEINPKTPEKKIKNGPDQMASW